MKKVSVIFVEEEFKTSGHSPFLATCNDFEKYVVKHDKGKSLCIINEFLACFLLEHFGLPFAASALVDIPFSIIKDNPTLSDKNKKAIYYEKPCFGSSFFKEIIDINNFGLNYTSDFFKRLNNPLEVLRIALFDAWVENDDRKPTNYNMLLVKDTGKYKAVPIDHSFIFETISHSFLDPSLFVAKDNDHLLEAGFGFFVKKQFTINERFVENERSYFLSSIHSCQKYFFTFAKELQIYYDFSDADIEKISLFLFDETRNQQVFEEHIYRLNN